MKDEGQLKLGLTGRERRLTLEQWLMEAEDQPRLRLTSRGLDGALPLAGTEVVRPDKRVDQRTQRRLILWADGHSRRRPATGGQGGGRNPFQRHEVVPAQA